MSLLSEYEERTAWKRERPSGLFPTAPGLGLKVGADGRFVPFPGTTAVFPLCGDGIKGFAELRDGLYGRLGAGTLAEMLPDSSLHMTLHDLVNPGNSVSGPDPAGYARELRKSLEDASAIAEELKARFGDRTVALRADGIVSMVSSSVVLLLKPATEDDMEGLTYLYRRFDSVKPLPYPLTPHITLAYYRPGTLDGDRLAAAFEGLRERAAGLGAVFSVRDLEVKYFADMKTYLPGMPGEG